MNSLVPPVKTATRVCIPFKRGLCFSARSLGRQGIDLLHGCMLQENLDYSGFTFLTREPTMTGVKWC